MALNDAAIAAMPAPTQAEVDEYGEFINQALNVTPAELATMRADLMYLGIDVAFLHKLNLMRTTAHRNHRPKNEQSAELLEDLKLILSAAILRGTKITKIQTKSQNAAAFAQLVNKYHIVTTSGVGGQAKGRGVVTLARMMAVYAPQVAQICKAMGRGQAPHQANMPAYIQFVSAPSIIPREGAHSALYGQWCVWYAEFCRLCRLDAFDAQNPGIYVTASRNSAAFPEERRVAIFDDLAQ